MKAIFFVTLIMFNIFTHESFANVINLKLNKDEIYRTSVYIILGLDINYDPPDGPYTKGVETGFQFELDADDPCLVSGTAIYHQINSNGMSVIYRDVRLFINFRHLEFSGSPNKGVTLLTNKGFNVFKQENSITHTGSDSPTRFNESILPGKNGEKSLQLGGWLISLYLAPKYNPAFSDDRWIKATKYMRELCSDGPF